MKTFELIAVKENAYVADTFDLYIECKETAQVMVADQVKIWDEDQESLEDMFEAVASGEWGKE